MKTALLAVKNLTFFGAGVFFLKLTPGFFRYRNIW